jgi:hypothetical protein
MKGLIKQLLREDMQTHFEMQNLAENVFSASIRYFVNKTINDKSSLSVVDKIPDMFTKINLGRYTNLRDFLNEYKLDLKYSSNLDSLGDFVAHSESNGEIFVRYDLITIKGAIEKAVFPILKANKPINQMVFNEMCKQVQSELYDKNVLSTILHELQHAYDSWRSEGMFMASKRGYDYDKKYGDLPKGTPMTPKQRDEYDKLEYEINARFTQAIRAIKFYDKNQQTNLLTPVTFDVLKAEFEEEFGAYEKMTPNFRKRLIKRLSKAYHQMLEIIDKHNKEISNGAINECLKEVELAMDALGKHYDTWHKFTY